MSKQFFFDEQNEKLSYVISAETYAKNITLKKFHPFKSIPLWRRLTLSFKILLIHFLKTLLKEKLYVRSDQRELCEVSPRTKALLSALINMKAVSYWQFSRMFPDRPRVNTCTIKINPFMTNTSKPIHSDRGLLSGGVGRSYNDALVYACAEAVERMCQCDFDKKNFLFHPYTHISKYKKTLSPDTFSHFSQTLKRKTQFESEKIGWQKARDIVTGKAVYIPAQLSYFSYFQIFKKESRITSVSSSGGAVHTSTAKAVYNGVCELIERDAFLIHWLHKIHAPVIDLDTIPDSFFAKKKIEDIQKHNIEFYVLDITTDIQVPVFCAIYIDKKNARPVSVCSSSDLDTKSLLEDVVLKSIRNMHPTHKTPNKKASKNTVHIKTINDREVFWTDFSKTKHIKNTLIGKEKKSWDKVTAQYPDIRFWNDKKKLCYIVEELKKASCRCYYTDITNRVAKNLNLKAVKTISPDLVPIYFVENEKPVLSPRLFSSLVSMGAHEKEKKYDSLNDIPHPFL